MSQEILVEKNRITALENAIEEYRRFYQSDSAFEKAVLLFKHQLRSFYFVEAPSWRILLRKFGVDKRAAPDFWLTGAVRSGTSTLSNYIFQHPCVALPLSKELSLAMYTLDFFRAQLPLDEELNKVRKEFGVAMTGHATPSAPASNMIYFNKKMNPAMKVVVILRNPVDRVISHWRWDLMRTENLLKDPLWKCMPGFEESMRIEINGLKEGSSGFLLSSGSGGTSYLRHSIYGPSLDLMIKEMGRENIYVVEAQDFFINTNEVVNGVYDFLGLPECKPILVKETNHSPPLDVSEGLKQELADFFKPFNEKLYELVGKDFSW